MAGLDESRDEAALVAVANEMLARLHVDMTVRNCVDINSLLFITLYEGLCAEHVKDIIEVPMTVEDEVHNCQAVIDSLSMDVLNISLSHITGHDIVAGDRTAIGDLLEVFSGLMEFMLEEISSSSSSNNVLYNTDDVSSHHHHHHHSPVTATVPQAVTHQSHVTHGTHQLTDRTSDAEQSITRSMQNVSLHPTLPTDSRHYDGVIKSTTAVSSATLSRPVMSMSNGRPLIAEAATPSPDNAIDALPTLNDTNTELPSHQFDNIGTGRQCRQPTNTGGMEDAAAAAAAAAAVKSQHTFTHHLYHHYDVEPITHHHHPHQLDTHADDGLNGVVSTKLSAALTDTSTLSQPVTSVSYTAADEARYTNNVSASSLLPSDSRASQLPVKRTLRLSHSESAITAAGPDTAVHQRKASGGVKPKMSSTGRQLSSKSTSLTSRGVFKSKSSADVASRDIAPFAATDYLTAAAAAGRHGDGDGDVTNRQPAMTYREYLQKYYGDSVRRQTPTGDMLDDDNDTSYLSDGCVDYNMNYSQQKSSANHTMTTFERELAGRRKQLHKKAKTVRFEDYLDSAASGYVGGLRRKFGAEEHKSRLRKQLLADVYGEELKEYTETSASELDNINNTAKDTEEKYKRSVLKPPQTARFKTNKYKKQSSVLVPRSRPYRRPRDRDRKRSASASPDLGRNDRSNDQHLLPWLLEEFPYLHLSPSTLQSLWRKGSLRLDQLSRADNETQRRKTKAQEQIEEAERRQQMLVEILHKEQHHRQRLKEARARQQLEIAARSMLRERRLQSARVRRYYNEYQVQHRSRMLKKRTKEEMVFKRLFSDGLDIQKERIRELRKYAKEQRQERAQRQQQELESLENYYKDRFALLAESMEREKHDITVREKAQTKVLEQMKRELRQKMERDISELQRRLCQDDDDVYMRQLDADRVRHKLRAARCQPRL